MNEEIDLKYRPATYFESGSFEDYMLSKVKGTVERNRIKAMVDNEELTGFNELYDEVYSALESSEALESVHPMFMGGNYLPNTHDDEVEIARISINSTTYDVTSVYASSHSGSLHYRVVDEYNGDTLCKPDTTITKSPMTLEELVSFFMKAWPLVEVLDMNFGDDEDGAFDFFSASSDFYPEFSRLVNKRVAEHFAGKGELNA